MAILVSCSSGVSEITIQEPRPVKSVIASKSEDVKRVYAGLSTPVAEVNLAFKVSGQIIDIPVVSGEYVEFGMVLSRIDPRDLELTVSADKASFEQAKSSYYRSVRLLEHEAISRQEVESTKSSFERAKSVYMNSLELLDQASLTAPFDAVIERVDVKEYERVQDGETIMRLVSPTTDQVSFTIPEGMLSALEDTRSHFIVVFDNYPGVEFKARVVEYARSSSDASGFPVKLAFDNPLPERYYINSGLSCSVIMVTPDKDMGAVVLPLSAIYAPISGGTFVWMIDSINHVKLLSVELGSPVGEHSIRINKGVLGGESIAVAGVYQLRENQEVNIVK